MAMPHTPPVRSTPPWRRAVQHGVLALGLAASSVADAYTLDALLRMPLERLLQLTISAKRASQRGTADLRLVDSVPASRGSHAS
jgi:hypothetical protein